MHKLCAVLVVVMVLMRHSSYIRIRRPSCGICHRRSLPLIKCLMCRIMRCRRCDWNSLVPCCTPGDGHYTDTTPIDYESDGYVSPHDLSSDLWNAQRRALCSRPYIRPFLYCIICGCQPCPWSEHRGHPIVCLRCRHCNMIFCEYCHLGHVEACNTQYNLPRRFS